MIQITITKGLPASGKSTWAEEQVLSAPANSIKRVNKDSLRAMLDGGRHSKGSESFVLTVRDFIIAQALKDGKHVIVDDTNLAPHHETRIRKLAEAHTTATGKKVTVNVKFFDISVDEAIARDLKRTKSVGERVIRKMYNDFLAPQQNEKVEARKVLKQDESLPHAIICDLDGTLALLDRSPYDVTKVDTDRLNEPIANIVKKYRYLGYRILLVSGREGTDVGANKTIAWLKLHGIQYDILIMREPGDKQKDATLKRSIYEDNIRDKYYVEFVLDDRQQVVDVWRDIGLTCLQVAPGDF